MLERKYSQIMDFCRLIFLFYKRDQQQKRSILMILEAYEEIDNQ